MDVKTLIRLETAGKKCFRALKRSARYGMQDIACSIAGLPITTERLCWEEFQTLVICRSRLSAGIVSEPSCPNSRHRK
jgi:hypothetical protein